MSFESYAAARRNPVLRDAARAAGLNEAELSARVATEAAGLATWARRAPGTTGVAGDLTLDVDVSAAITAGFAVST